MNKNKRFETEYREYKRELPEKLENSVIAFLNTGGGEIHVGVNDDGTIYDLPNLDESIRTFTNRVKENISPSVIGLFTIAVKEDKNKKYFIVTIASGIDKPYFLVNLDFYTPDGKFNYLAYLMADDNGTSIKIAKFIGNDPSPIEKDEFGRRCLIKAAYSILDKLKIYNNTAIEFKYPNRIETNLVDAAALREASLNAIIH